MTTSPAVLLCFDGSEGALRAIEDAGRLLGPRTAVARQPPRRPPGPHRP